ncbi:MAG: DUF2207 domain-containing protein [Acidimicrobiales bacterium]
MNQLRRPRLRHLLLVLGLPIVVAGSAVGAAGATPTVAAQTGSERIVSFDSTVVVNKDGSADITEVIDYDFGYTSRHGIERYIPTVFPWTGASPKGSSPGATFDRVTPISDVEVSASGDTPADTDISQETADGQDQTKIRIGDPDTTITGEHTYTIRYKLAGVLNGFADHDELYLEITGHGWSVPIEATKATVKVPGSVSKITCFAGGNGSQLVCASANKSENATNGQATFSQGPLGAGEGLTVVVAMPKGEVTNPDTTRILRERWSLASAFRLNGLTGAASGLLLLGGVGGIGLLGWRNGRDRRYAGSAVDAAFGNASGDDGPVPLFDKSPNTVEFVPPEGIRPGHMGTLWDEQANHLDVSAMIVDLAVRGWLRIDEIAPQSQGFLGFGGDGGDFQLVQLIDHTTDARASELWEAEKALLGSLFATGNVIKLSELKTKFADKLELIESKLYDDAVAADWFPVRPDLVRQRWLGRGVLLLVVGCGLVYLAARYTHLGLVALPVPIVGLLLIVSAKYFPRRTAKGSALLGRVKGFKELFDAGEGERQRFAEQHNLFAQYLPYAIVFGCTEKWAQVFEGLGLSPQEMGLGVWYTSPYAYDPLHFGYAMSSFTTHSTGSLAAAAPSSSGGASSGGSGFGGGFSGGGFGGGGGGSW